MGEIREEVARGQEGACRVLRPLRIGARVHRGVPHQLLAHQPQAKAIVRGLR